MTTFSTVKKWAWKMASDMHSPYKTDEQKQAIKDDAYTQISTLTEIHGNSENFKKAMTEALETYDEYLSYKINDETGKERIRTCEKHFNDYLYG